MSTKIEIDIDELKAEVKDLLLAAERDRITPKPVQRIGEIIDVVLSYKSAIVKANTPRNFDFKSPNCKNNKTLLRQHRKECLADADPATGVAPLRNWLAKLDCAFVLGGQLFWRLNDSDWETSVWRPLCEWVERGYALLFVDSKNAKWPWPIDVSEMARWEVEEQELERRLFVKMATFLPKDDSPVLDDNQPFTIRWRDCSCYLGDNDGFKILKRLIEAKHRMVTRQNIGLRRWAKII